MSSGGVKGIHTAQEWRLKSIWLAPVSFVLLCLSMAIATIGTAAVAVFGTGYLFPMVFRSLFGGESMPVWGIIMVPVFILALVFLLAVPIFLSMLVAALRKWLCYR